MLCWHLGAALKTVAHSRHLLCTAVSLRDDFRAYLPELLPRFIGLFAEAERSGNYDQVPVPAHSPSSPSPVPSRCFVLFGLRLRGRCLPASSSLSINLEIVYLNRHSADVTV
jgi:hypothetical protein